VPLFLSRGSLSNLHIPITNSPNSKDMTTGAIVSVKIIDIDESDTLNPRNADAYGEFLKEVNALKILSENNARNINHVIEALPVGPAMWMVTEFCAGGSIATLVSSLVSFSHVANCF
jgi:serine/threonine protein kinase